MTQPAAPETAVPERASGRPTTGPMGISPSETLAAASRVGPLLLAGAIVAFAAGVWGVPTGVLVQGVIIGALTSLLALGLALVWRANRIINFAAGDLGGAPATLAVLLTISTVALNWWVALVAGLAAAVLVGAAVEFLLVRRFSNSPRLVLSVATIGIAQVLAAGTLLLPRYFTVTGRSIPQPFDLHLTISPITFRGADLVALATVPIVLVGLALFLRRSDVGIAVRAGADRADRAASLGIPIRRLQTIVWVLAAVLGFLGEPAGARPRLTGRELEVARLVADGLTNHSIAVRLSIAPRTAEAHVENIRRKLEVRSRAQIAAWITEHRQAAR